MTALTTIEQASPEWLTEVLCRQGCLPSGQVRALSVTRVHAEQVYSISYFLTVTYSSGAPATAPTRLYLKLSRPEIDPAMVAWQGEREVRMYQAVARDQHDLPVIPWYDAVYDADRPAYHLLLADLSTTHDQPSSWTISDYYITQTVDCLARLHAYWWEHSRLNNGMGELATAEWLATEIDRLQEAYVPFARLAGDRLSVDDRCIYESVLAALPALWERRTRLAGQTIVHGDAHFWNILYPLDPQTHHTCILDWQTYHISPGTKDLAYTIVLRYPQRTVANERTLVKRYHERLLAYGVHDYGWETCWRDYRLLAAEHVLYPMRWWMSGLPQDFWGMFVRPALTGFRDLGCAQLLR
jgi:Phosphotransferase enzyme family